jgi:hypothetical protein
MVQVIGDADGRHGAHKVHITQELRALAMDRAGRRCECTGANCRHHLRGARCKRGLRGDGWKIFWRSEDGGDTRENMEAWCLECFENNFEVPRETVALLAPHIADYARLMEEDQRRAITLKSVLRDAAQRAATEYRGRMVLDRLDDDVLVEFPTSRDAIDAARSLFSGFQMIASRLDLEVPDLCGAIHCGEVTRWRNGFLVGDAVGVTLGIREIAGGGRIVLTGPAVEPLKQSLPLEPVRGEVPSDLPSIVEVWSLRVAEG